MAVEPDARPSPMERKLALLDPVAQKVADELGVTVTAPTKLAFNGDRGNVATASMKENEYGRLVPTVPPDGTWIDFKPRNEGGKNA